MFTGLLAVAILVGFVAAGFSFAAHGSFLIALLAYSAAGTCVMLTAMLYVAVRDRDAEEEADTTETEPVREAA